MAKSRSNSVAEVAGRGLGYVIAILAAVCILIISVLPLYFVYLALGARVKVNRILKKSGNRRHFWLNKEEIIRFKAICHKAIEARDNLKKAVSFAESHGITKNKDGQYSMRSQKGKEVRSIIDQSNEIMANAVREIKETEIKPYLAWKNADKAFRNSKAGVYGLVGFIIAVPICYNEATSATTYPYGEELHYIFWWCAACMSGGFLYLFPRYLFSSPIKAYFEEPPIVDMKNVDIWGVNPKQEEDIQATEVAEPEAENITANTSPDKNGGYESATGGRKVISILFKIGSAAYITLILVLLFDTYEAGNVSFLAEMIANFVILSPGLIGLLIGSVLSNRKKQPVGCN